MTTDRLETDLGLRIFVITSKTLRISTEHIKPICSLESKLSFDCIYSVEILNILQVMTKIAQPWPDWLVKIHRVNVGQTGPDPLTISKWSSRVDFILIQIHWQHCHAWFFHLTVFLLLKVFFIAWTTRARTRTTSFLAFWFWLFSTWWWATSAWGT